MSEQPTDASESTYAIEQRKADKGPFWSSLASGFTDELEAIATADFFRTTRTNTELRVVKKTVLISYDAQPREKE